MDSALQMLNSYSCRTLQSFVVVLDINVVSVTKCTAVFSPDLPNFTVVLMRMTRSFLAASPPLPSEAEILSQLR